MVVDNELSLESVKVLYNDAEYNWSKNVDQSLDLTDIFIENHGGDVNDDDSYSIVMTRTKHCDEIYMKLVHKKSGKLERIHEVTCMGDAQLVYSDFLNYAKNLVNSKIQ